MTWAPTEEHSGPDLAVLILPDSEIGEITARKSFFDISVNREEKLADSLAFGGLWAVAGSPKHYERALGPSHGFSVVTEHPCIVFYTGLRDRYDHGDFDFLHLGVQGDYSDKIPDSFRGMSGGGVWKVCVLRERMTLAWSVDFMETVLAGVVFYETRSNGKPDGLRCQGGKSIYNRVFEKVRERLLRDGG